MSLKKEALRVLVVSSSTKMKELLNNTLPETQYPNIVSVSTCGEAKRALVDGSYDLLIINTPLSDDFGVQTALDVVDEHALGILLLVKNDIYEQVTYKVEESGIVTLPKPTTKQALYSAIKTLTALIFKIKAMKRETLNLKNKMDEIRLISRAKWILIDQLHMTEPQAHRYIEKQAMDRCIKKQEVAYNIIRTYEQ